MRALLPVLLIVGVPLAGYLAYRSWKQEQQRRAMVLQWATNSGFGYAVEDESWCNRWNAAPFGEGSDRRARNVVTGLSSGRSFATFDYSYETQSTDAQGRTTTTTHRYLVTTVQLPAYLPRLQVTPENVLTRIGNALGLDDIELESEDFNRRFRVSSNDRKFACDVLTPTTMELLLARSAPSWRIDGPDLVAWEDGRVTPARVLATLDVMGSIVTGIPTFVWHDHEAGGSA